jgi:ABC-type branched-subunit amino acid transport system ATPase component/branched-subunit amino acid ABC-type transport system permease component
VEVITLTVVGLGAGALYALIAQGLILTYRASHLVNFAQGAFVMVGAYVYYQLTVEWHLPAIAGVIMTPFVGAIFGALVQVLVLRRMRQQSPLLRVVATLGVLIVLQAAAVLVYGVNVRSVPSFLPTRRFAFSGVSVGLDRILMLAIGLVLTVALWWLYRSTAFGRATTAVSENVRVAASLGYSPDRIATANWAAGAALAAFAGSLIAPITFLDPSDLVLLIIPALAVGVVANFSSFPWAFITALALGVAESLLARYVSSAGWSESLPFLAVIAVLLFRGQTLPSRGHIFERLPSVSNGRVRPVWLTISFVVLIVLIMKVLPFTWVGALTVTMGYSILCLSIVLVTGYGGQLSLAQWVLAGVGALTASKIMVDWHWPFLAALVGGAVLTMAVGFVVGLPALRTRGISLAIATLGLGVAVYDIVLSSYSLTGGASGVSLPPIKIFGFDVDGIIQPDRYAVMVAIVLFGSGLALLNLRRSVLGRRLLAVRGNERASAALGISVFGVKLFAFAAAAALAGIAGTLIGFVNGNVISSTFDPFDSITIVADTVVGGVGLVGGGVAGSTLVPGGIGSQILDTWNIAAWLPLIGGLTLLQILVTNPSGLWAMNKKLVAEVGGLAHRGLRRLGPPASGRRPALPWRRARRAALASLEQIGASIGVPSMVLQVHDLRVRFGGAVAVNGVSLAVQPGEIHGLIGPNGAGKTTTIDAITGFVRTSGGIVRIGDRDISRWSARRRAGAGVGRSFQAVELFDDLTVRENLAVACEEWKWSKYLTAFVRPGRMRLSAAAQAVAAEFGLSAIMDRVPGDLPLGMRRLASIARAASAQPSVLCLDEPAAGLSDAEVAKLIDLLQLLAKKWGMGILLVEHNVDMVLACCDSVTVLASGAILASGPPADIRSDPRVLDAYLGKRTPAPPDDKLPHAV